MPTHTELKRIAAAAEVDPRTVRQAYAGKTVRAASLNRIARAASGLGFDAPPGAPVLAVQAPGHVMLKRLDAEEEPVPEAAPPAGPFILQAAGNVKPSLKAFVELPISVQHVWDAFPIVDSALQELEQGQFLNAALLADAVRADDRAIGCLSTRVNAIFGLPMEFKWQGQAEEHASAMPGGTPAPAATGAAPAGGTTQHVGDSGDSPEVVALKQKVAKLVEDNWERMVPSATAKELATWGILLNMGIGELVWAWDKGPGGEDLVFPTLKSWHPQFIYWRWDTRSFWLIHQAGQVELTPGDGRWILFTPNGHNHGWLYGLIRALAKLWLDRQFLWRDWARASEKFALGIVKAFVPSEASAQDKAAFLASLQNMASESTVQLPRYAEGKPGFDVEMMSTSDSSVNTDAFFETRLKRIDISMAVCILGQNLSTEISGSSGSRAAAQVHENVRADFLEADVEMLSQMFATMLLTPFVRYNFEDQADALGVDWRKLVPEVTWKVDPPEDEAKAADAVAKIAGAVKDLAGTETDIHALLDKHKIPVLDEKRSPDRPPPVPGQQPERPRGPGGTVAMPPPGLGDKPSPDGSADQPLEVEAGRALLSLAKSFRRSSAVVHVKPGQRKGRVVIDELLEGAMAAAASALEPRRRELLRIINEAESYEQMREDIKKLYAGSGAAELRGIIEKAYATAQLLGHLSATVDHRQGEPK